MTESEWLASNDPYKMSLHVVKGSARKLRLFAVACARRVPAELINEDCRKLLDAAEASAEGQITPPQRRKIEKAVQKLALELEHEWRAALHAGDWTSLAYRKYSAIAACGMTSQANRDMMLGAQNEAARASDNEDAEKQYQCAILRDIYGNPFQPAPFKSAWRSAEVVALAEAIETSWDVELFRKLATALELFGCGHAEILAHCRSKGPHVHGCWLIDLILEKE